MNDAVLKSWQLERPAVRGLWPVAVGTGMVVAILSVAGAILVTALKSQAPPPAAPSPPPRPTWVEIQRPVQIFDLSAPALAGLPLVYTARRLSNGEGREDVLAFGEIAGEAPALRLDLLRRTARPGTPAPLFAALAREAADVGLAIDRSGLPDLIRTRFGTFEIADLAMGGLPAGKSCNGFRLALDAQGLTMTGLACGTSARPILRGDLACLLDRLDLASAGDDHVLRDFFAASELTRDAACAGMRLGPDAVHAAWLDDKPMPHRKSATLGKRSRRH